MKLFILVLIEIASCQWTADHWSPPTPGLYERVEILKLKLNKQIREQQQELKIRSTTERNNGDHNPRTQQLIAPINYKQAINDDYEYVDMEKVPITPIMDFDDRKKKNKFKLHKIKPKPEMETTTAANLAVAKQNASIHKKLEGLLRMKKLRSKRPIADIFYRRFTDEKSRNTPSEWTHCQCLISPFLNGFKTDISDIRRITVNENIVRRLVQLFTENTSSYTKEEIYSVMYQISNMQLRFFDWDVAAVENLLNAIANEQRHSFRTVKAGLKRIFDGWRLTFGNTTNILQQTRVYRPPCVVTSDFSGSTKSSTIVRYYTKSTTKKNNCQEEDDDDEC